MMSRELLIWARAQSLPRGPKAVLKCLAAFHTIENGCFPTQKKICTETDYCESSVNAHLAALVNLGLIHRQRRAIDGKRTSTLYTFPAFENALGGRQVVDHKADQPKTANSRNCAEKVQQPELEVLRKLETNIKHNQLESIMSETKDPIVEKTVSELEKLFAFHNKASSTLKASSKTFRDYIRTWVEEMALSPEQIVAIAKAVLDRANQEVHSLRYFAEEMRKASANKIRSAPTTMQHGWQSTMSMWAEKIKNGSYIPPGGINPSMAAEMLRHGLVSETELKARQIHFSSYAIEDA